MSPLSAHLWAFSKGYECKDSDYFDKLYRNWEEIFKKVGKVYEMARKQVGKVPFLPSKWVGKVAETTLVSNLAKCALKRQIIALVEANYCPLRGKELLLKR